MPNQQYAKLMARYNMWQNDSLINASNTLSDDERQQDRGAFFGSIEQTFSHVLWGDQLWMSRFAGTPAPDGGIPESNWMITGWAAFCEERRTFDQRILQWTDEVNPDWFVGDMTWYSGAMDREITKPKDILVVQLFNHQTHHRGQIHGMLTAAGAKPSDTDVPFMPEEFATL